ncbi:Concanavalin A-like lectin/glucanases superfamily protein [Mariniphaga anaerophila]|uniref:Concanavalin A-like lectin/glucanases superfamily protein n=1 Tax=Mariniphaga anaerophila TaxID=1484053 RepID=A0A1M4SL86_9BACT|nr:DUF4972 domain-containing protein [Mariniphaga anaerophila]SHE32939.1 Concanavalin A-like lectin/glucanases superfamily protein [Mariniphaga anaerophila]
MNKTITFSRLSISIMLGLFLGSLLFSCSKDDDSGAEILGYISQLKDKAEELISLRNDAEYGDEIGMYPEESKELLNEAITMLDDAARRIEDGVETKPSQRKVDQLLAEADNIVVQFKETVNLEESEKSYELYVGGLSDGGYIDFGSSSDYTNFGEIGDQAFTVELFLKLNDYTDFGPVISTFIEDEANLQRTGWSVNTYGEKMRMTYCTDYYYGLSEGGFEFNDGSLDKWIHYAAVYNDKGFDNEKIDNKLVVAKLYKNGILAASVTLPYEGPNPYKPYSGDVAPMVAFAQTKADGHVETGRRTNGYIKHFHIWKGIKTQEEILSLAKEEAEVLGTEDDLVCGWDFTTKPAGEETTIEDITGRHEATIIGTHTWEVIKK